MYGKHFQSMYEGSMYGAGVAVFAVWGYVISHSMDGHIELNPMKLAHTLGGTVQEIVLAIDRLCQPDPNSRHKEHEGRRMIKEGEFQYYIPSWSYYRGIRDESDRREYNRIAKRRERARRKGVDQLPETQTQPEPAVDPGDDDGMSVTARERKRKTLARIAAAEADEQAVRDKYNPEWREQTAARRQELQRNAGLSAREIVNRNVREDPITKADRASMRSKQTQTNAVEREYDLDYPADPIPPESGDAADGSTGQITPEPGGGTTQGPV